MDYAHLLRRARFVVSSMALVATLLLSFAFAAAQSATPSKTPTARATSAAPFEPLTQADLNILTGNVQRPNGIAYFDNLLYTACTGDGTIYEINSETGLTSTYIWGIINAHTMYVEQGDDRALRLWVPDYTENSLKEVTRFGVERIAANLQGPWGIAYLDDEQFLITNLLGGNVSRVTRAGDVVVVLDGLASPAGLVHDGEYVYIANNGSARRAIEWYPLEALATAEMSAAMPDEQVLVSGVQNPTGLQLAEDGNLYFAYSLANRGVVGRVNPQTCLANGGCSNADVEIVLYTDLDAPLAGLVVTPDMRIFVHTMFAPELYWARLS